MTFSFDERGNLKTLQPIEASWEDVEHFFVQRMANSDTRRQLWTNFAEFTLRFREEVAQAFTIWLDGSFVTRKVNPRDIDAVFLIDYRVCERSKSVLENRWFIAENKLKKGLDLYYSIEYPENHKRHFLTHLNRLYWLDIYGHTRKDITGRQQIKGFIQITI